MLSHLELKKTSDCCSEIESEFNLRVPSSFCAGIASLEPETTRDTRHVKETLILKLDKSAADRLGFA